MRVMLDYDDPASYRLFLRAKALPRYRVGGCHVEFPDEYAHLAGVAPPAPAVADYAPELWLFDYQRDVALKLGRRAYGVELKPEYHAEAVRNCEAALSLRRADARSLFDAEAVP